VNSTAFQFTFGTQTGRSYTVERGTALSSTNWQSFTNIVGTGANVTVEDGTAGAGQRFYRVLTQ
jgi:hypothetical protein